MVYSLGYAILKPQRLRDADSIETRPHVWHWYVDVFMQICDIVSPNFTAICYQAYHFFQILYLILALFKGDFILLLRFEYTTYRNYKE